MEPVMTIIVPMYNVEDYLPECLDSLVNQSIGISRLEVILVDDCSTDGSSRIAASYADRYPGIKVVSQDRNRGTGAARNKGFQLATAPYITFVDADDFVSLDMVAQALHYFEIEKCDLVLYEYQYFSRSGKRYPRNPSGRLFEAREEYFISDISIFPEIIFATSVCNKVFHKSLLLDRAFPNSHVEDILTSTLATFQARKIAVTSRCTYYYRKREGSSDPSKTDGYYARKNHYWDHLKANMDMFALIANYPQFKKMIDWFNIRSIQPFLFHMLFNRDFKLREKIEFFSQVKDLVSNVDEEIIGKLEHRQSQFVMRAAKRLPFSLFMLFIIANKAKRPFARLYHVFKKGIKAADMILAVVISFTFRWRSRYRDVWIVCERGDEAKDNGYWFFKFLREQTNQNVYYLIDFKQRLDYEKVRALGNVVQYRGMKHKILFILANKLITAHKGTIEPWNYETFMKIARKFRFQKQYIFLQHGITKDDVSGTLGRANAPFDLFITGGKPEHDYIASHFGYRPDQVVYTGFSRFDALNNNSTKQQILLMPTWRSSIIWKPSEEDKEKVFLESSYYSTYQSLINNNVLLQWLQEQNYTLVFYPHYEVQKYLGLFTRHSPSIILADKETYDVQALLKESKILITDYSSVFFDFAYMEKPIIFYQFDENTFFKSHYAKGYFDYRRDGFGPVVKSEEEIVAFIRESHAQGYSLRSEYRTRVRNFFQFRDQDNARRIYDAILSMDEGGPNS